MKILVKDLSVGQVIKGAVFAIKASTVRQTKTKKDYLQCTFFDGQQDISGNVWDWSGEALPANTIVVIDGSVGEWSGNKQFNISHIKVTTDYTILDFAPTGDVNVELEWRRAEGLIDMIKDEEIKLLVSDVYNTFKARLMTAPGAIAMHHNYVHGCLEHLVGVATTAVTLASQYNANLDIVIAGGLLHDIGKLFEYQMDGVSITTTLDGELLYHIPIGAMLVDRYRDRVKPAKLKLIQHIILSHHGKQEYGSPVVPKFLEAMIVHFADDIDAKCKTVAEANKKATGQLTDKVWALGNTVLITQSYIAEVLSGSNE